MHNSATPNARSRAGSDKVDRKPSRVRSTIKKMISVLDRLLRFASELNYFWKVCQSQFDFEFMKISKVWEEQPAVSSQQSRKKSREIDRAMLLARRF